MRERRWVFAPPDREAAARLTEALRIAPLTATLLVNRGVRDAAEAQRFLQPDLSHLIDPLRLEGMEIAVRRLEDALREREKIGIFGDYDVDGTSATAILLKIITLLGHSATYRVPHRVREGYGLNAEAVEAFAAEGVRVLLVVDCGTKEVEQIALARSRGMDVIVVDHHESGTVLPPALAVLNPKLSGSTYGFTGICSAGLAFKLAWALAERTRAKHRAGFEDYILDAMALAALGTVADVCPVMGENRVFIRYGLDALRACRSPGLKALLERTGLQGKPVDAFDVGFKLAPRMNAVGRMGTALECVELLVSRDARRIEEILDTLEKANRNRKGVEDEIFQQACAQVEETGAEDAAVVVADERWHLGVVGIVASRLVKRYGRPAFVLAVEKGVARGSARSVAGFPLHEALEACAETLLTHGGHAMAAGLSLDSRKLDAFRRKMCREVQRLLTPERRQPCLEVEEEVALGSLTRALVREIERLAPYGPGNPEPVLAASHVKVAGEPRLMGKKNDHISFFVAQDGASLRAVGFRMGDEDAALRKARSISLAFVPRINEWRGNESVELRVEDIKIDS